MQGTDGGEARWHSWRRAGATYLRWLGLPLRHLLWWGRWHSITIAHLYVSPPHEFECVQITRLLWLANDGIRWRKTDIRELWPPSLTNHSTTTRQSGNHQPKASGRDTNGMTEGQRRTRPRETRRAVPAAWREEDQSPGARIPRKPQGREHQRTLSLPGARGPWT